VATNTSVSAFGSVGLLIYDECFPHCLFPNARRPYEGTVLGARPAHGHQMHELGSIEMVKEAASAGFFKTPFGQFPRIQIVTVEQLLEGKIPKLPPQERGGL
jgi:hypothetical protein